MKNEMNFECKVENKSDIIRELTIKVKPETIKTYVEKQLSLFQKKAKIPGFRQGKVPLSIIKQRFLHDAKSEAVSEIIQDTYFEAIAKEKIMAVGNPKITPKSGLTLNDGEELEYVASVEVLPEIKFPDFKKIKVKKPNDKITDEQVNKSLEELQRTYAEIVSDEKNEGPVKDGDLIELSFKGSIDGKSNPSLNAEHRMLKVGSGQYIDGFEKNILGMKKGETKKFTIRFPKDYAYKEYADKEAEFEVTVHDFKKENLPELNDDFAKNFKLEKLNDLKNKIKEDLEKRAQEQAKTTLRERVVDALIQETKFEVPKHFINMQVDYLARENANTLLRQGFKEADIQKYLSKNQDQLKERAEKQVRATLIIDKIATENNIVVNDKDIDFEISKIAKEQNVDEKEVRKFFENESNLRELKFRLKEEKTFDFILENIKVELEK